MLRVGCKTSRGNLSAREQNAVVFSSRARCGALLQRAMRRVPRAARVRCASDAIHCAQRDWSAEFSDVQQLLTRAAQES